MRREKTPPNNAGLAVPVGRNSRKKLVGASRPQKSASLIGKDKRAEERQRKLNETLAVLFQFAPDAIIVVDEGGCIVRVNDQARAMFGSLSHSRQTERLEGANCLGSHRISAHFGRREINNIIDRSCAMCSSASLVRKA